MLRLWRLPSLSHADWSAQMTDPKAEFSEAAEAYVRDIKKFSAKELEELITVLFRADDIEIQAILNDPTAPRIKKIMAQVLDKAMETGNMSQVDMVFNRVVGKVKEKVELLGKPSILVTTDGKQFKFAHGKNEDEE
jgi:hypothetical protein